MPIPVLVPVLLHVPYLVFDLVLDPVLVLIFVFVLFLVLKEHTNRGPWNLQFPLLRRSLDKQDLCPCISTDVGIHGHAEDIVGMGKRTNESIFKELGLFSRCFQPILQFFAQLYVNRKTAFIKSNCPKTS